MPAERWRALLGASVAPVAAFLLALIAAKIAAGAAEVPVTASRSWARWDSSIYLHIAKQGYTLERCTPGGFGAPSPDAHWCGNAAQFPLYSLGIAVLHWAGLSLVAAGVALSALFSLATLLLLWFGFFGAERSATSLLCIALAALFPGWVYYHAVFPMAMATFLVLLCFYLCQRRALTAAGVAGGMFAASYSSGVLLAPVLLLWALLDRRGAPRFAERLSQGFVMGGLTALGFAAVLAVQKAQTGAWDAFFKIQAGYRHGFHDPLATVWHRFQAVRDGQPDPGAFLKVADTELMDRLGGFYLIPEVQTLLVAAIMAVVLVYVLRRPEHRSGVSLLVVIFTAVFWLFPLTQQHIGYSRTESLLLPVVLLIRWLPIAAQVAILSAAALVAVPMAFVFFEHIVI